MLLALLITAVFCLFIWLVFFQFKWLRFSIAWAVVSVFFVVHVVLAFLIGTRFVAPYSDDAKVVQHTIQLVPRLSEPTLVTAVLVSPNAMVKRGQPLFQFDRRPYQYKVNKLEAELAKAKQDVLILGTEESAAIQKAAKAQSDLVYADYQQKLTGQLAETNAGSEEDARKWQAEQGKARAGVKEALAQAEQARLKAQSRINGVNTTVAAVEAQLAEQRYFLDNTTLVAPEDGRIINLQVRAGMVSGDIRAGAIATLICDADRYLLASYDQEVLKYVKPGQPVEIALDLHPGQIFYGTLEEIWPSGVGQLLPSGRMLSFEPPPPELPQGRFAAKININRIDPAAVPIGAQGTSAIYTSWGGFAYFRRVSIRMHSWLNWIYPDPF